MATPSKHVILFAHGACHTPWHYEKVTTLLRETGFDVHIPQLPSSNGLRPPNAGLSSDTDVFRAYATKLVDAGHSLVVVTHSYGGVVATNALHGLSIGARREKGLSGGVTHLIYAAGSLPLPQGVSVWDASAAAGVGDRMRDVLWKFEKDDSVLPYDAAKAFAGDEYAADHQQEVDEYVAKLQSFNGKAFYDQPTNIAAWKDTGLEKVVYTIGTQDIVVMEDGQRGIVEILRGEGVKLDVMETDWAHCPNLTSPQDLFNVLVKAISV